jgi:hypothetical protein
MHHPIKSKIIKWLFPTPFANSTEFKSGSNPLFVSKYISSNALYCAEFKPIKRDGKCSLIVNAALAAS